jgi:hypothetical protein
MTKHSNIFGLISLHVLKSEKILLKYFQFYEQFFTLSLLLHTLHLVYYFVHYQIGVLDK